MPDILIPAAGDFDAWPRRHACCLAVDWDGTCKDTMTAKWRRGFNLAITRIWPSLAPYQAQVDEVCFQVNMVDEATAGVQRFVALTIMMERWAARGLPVPDLGTFARAVADVEARGEQHGTATYRRLQAQYGYDDAPLRWSDLSDELIARSARDAVVFDGCREAIEGVRERADIVVVSASKTEAVRDDLRRDGMAGLFDALLAQDFLPKSGTLAGLARKYDRVLFVGDTAGDARAAAGAGVNFYRIATGGESASWAAAPAVFEAVVGR
ncbi:MAG: HAD hydrolase-like protein [Planctomycetes bacterium]|nr:HAD hydrolase-like protein [Planctomycetota bacterium]